MVYDAKKVIKAMVEEYPAIRTIYISPNIANKEWVTFDLKVIGDFETEKELENLSADYQAVFYNDKKLARIETITLFLKNNNEEFSENSFRQEGLIKIYDI